MFAPGELLMLRADNALIRAAHTVGGNYWCTPDLVQNKALTYTKAFHVVPVQISITGTLIVTNRRLLFVTHENTVHFGFPVSHIRHVNTQDAESNAALSTVILQLFTPHQVMLSVQVGTLPVVLDTLRKLVVDPVLTPVSPSFCAGIARLFPMSSSLVSAYDIRHFAALPPFLFRTASPCESFVYSAEHAGIAREIPGYERLAPQVLEYYSSRGFGLYDPIREYRRMGVGMTMPTPPQLAKLVFGAKIHPDLLAYLLRYKPARSPRYYEDAQAITARCYLAQPTSKFMGHPQVQQVYSRVYMSNFFDPYTLFDTPVQFYTLLSYHPQVVDASSYLQNLDAVFDEEDAEADPSQPAASQPPSSASSVAPQTQTQYSSFNFSLQDPQSGAFLYAHGAFFEPTYFRVNPHLRHYVKFFLANAVPDHIDQVHAPPMRPPYLPSDGWRITWANVAYEKSPTYPAVLSVPEAASDEVVLGAMRFRSKGRFCAMSWRSPCTGAALCRCSQPGKGFGVGRSGSDEALLRAIVNAPPSDEASNLLFVFDARPHLSAVANRLTGKGYESAKAYPFAKTVYLNIQNIHKVRDSYGAMRRTAMEFLSTVEPNFRGLATTDPARLTMNERVDMMRRSIGLIAGSTLGVYRDAEASKWYEHIQTIIAGSVMICEAMTKLRCHAIIHCSDGWDRTSQLSALSMLLLDPYYRTLKGFCILVEKEWCSFGHMFATRCRQSGSTKARPRKDDGKFYAETTVGVPVSVMPSLAPAPLDARGVEGFAGGQPLSDAHALARPCAVPMGTTNGAAIRSMPSDPSLEHSHSSRSSFAGRQPYIWATEPQCPPVLNPIIPGQTSVVPQPRVTLGNVPPPASLGVEMDSRLPDIMPRPYVPPSGDGAPATSAAPAISAASAVSAASTASGRGRPSPDSVGASQSSGTSEASQKSDSAPEPARLGDKPPVVASSVLASEAQTESTEMQATLSTSLSNIQQLQPQPSAGPPCSASTQPPPADERAEYAQKVRQQRMHEFLHAVKSQEVPPPITVPQSPLDFSESQTSPIFLQWLECVYQALVQCPDAFEFNDKVLLYIVHHLYAGYHGTFVFDNERDRTHHLMSTLTTSVWDAFLKAPGYYLNSKYKIDSPLNLIKMTTGVSYLRLSCSARLIKPWTAYWSQVSDFAGK